MASVLPGPSRALRPAPRRPLSVPTCGPGCAALGERCAGSSATPVRSRRGAAPGSRRAALPAPPLLGFAQLVRNLATRWVFRGRAEGRGEARGGGAWAGGAGSAGGGWGRGGCAGARPPGEGPAGAAGPLPGSPAPAPRFLQSGCLPPSQMPSHSVRASRLPTFPQSLSSPFLPLLPPFFHVPLPILPSPFPFLFLCLSSPHSLSKPPSSAWPAPFSPSSSHFLLLLQSVDLYPVLAWG